jgi:thiol-disulfide isomerase/thioredoxin
MSSIDFKYRVIFFHQEHCGPCQSMRPYWADAAGEISEEYPHYSVGFAMWDVNDDDWQFADLVGIDGTPGFAIFNDEGDVLAINTEGAMPKTALKSWIIRAIEEDQK